MTPAHIMDCITGKDPWASGTWIFYSGQYVGLPFPWKGTLSLFYKAVKKPVLCFRATHVFQSSLLYKYPWKDRLKQSVASVSFDKHEEMWETYG